MVRKKEPVHEVTRVALKKVLVVQTAFIGDAILASSLLEQIHCDYPDCRIDLLVRRGNEGLFKSHPFLNEVLVWDKKAGKYKSLWALLKRIRRERYSAVFNLQRFGSTGFLTAFSRADYTVGFRKNPFSRWFSERKVHLYRDGLHEIDRNALLFETFALGKTPPPRLYPTAEDFEKVAGLKTRPFVCMAPASVWFTKQYPVEKWVDLIDKTPEHFRIFLIGGPGDKDLLDLIHQKVSRANVENMAGKFGLLASAALMRDAAMNYVNDSAPMHLCSSVNAPVTAIYCSTVPEFGYGPLSEQSFVAQTAKELACRPCGLHGYKKCPEGHFECGHSITTGVLLGQMKV